VLAGIKAFQILTKGKLMSLARASAKVEVIRLSLLALDTAF
jgi:hypothetical protein